MDSKNNSIKVALWGFGVMNKIILKLVIEQGYQVVAVIGRHNIGEDAGIVGELQEIGVLIDSPQQAEEVLQRTKPDICIQSTRTYVKEVAEDLKLLAKNKINTLTLAEESYYSWGTEPELSKELDDIFKQNGVTLTGAGFQEVYWSYLPCLFLGITHQSSKLICHSQFNLDDYGESSNFGVGLTPEEFEIQFIQTKQPPSFFWNTNEWICSRLGYSVISTTQIYQPLIVTDHEILSKSYGQLKVGNAKGVTIIVNTQAKDKMGKIFEIESHSIGQVYDRPDMEDYCKWQIIGTPSVEVYCRNIETALATCTSAVNRIQSIINAKPGFVTTSELGPLI